MSNHFDFDLFEECICGHEWRRHAGYQCSVCDDCKEFASINASPDSVSETCPDCGHRVSTHDVKGSEDFRDGRRDAFSSSNPRPGCNHYKPGALPNSRCSCTLAPEIIINERKHTMATAKSKTKYTLPNGTEYLTRALGGFDNDVEGLRELRSQGKHILLLGEPGCGKTALHQVAFPDSENEIGHSKLTAWDMLWRPRPMPDGSIVFDPSPLTRAVQNGRPFYMDEIMRSSEDALTPLFSAMDGRGFIVGGNLDGTDMPVKEGFIVVGASNPLVRGAFLPDAIASRFHILTVETSEDLLVRMGLDDRLLVAWRNLSNMDGGDSWRPSIREMLAAQSFIDAGNMHQAAFALTGWRVPARDREKVAGVISPLLGVRVGEFGGVIK